METDLAYVTFEQAKSLKEKGFNMENLKSGFHGDFGDLEGDDYPFLGTYTFMDSIFVKNNSEWKIQRPEQWQVVEWLWTNHGIWVEVTPDSYGEEWFVTCKPCSKKAWDDFEFRSKIHLSKLHFLYYKSPQEAYSAAFDYILKELI